ncbi:MAG: ester cyclase [Anaerolineaceae bacterium]|nr:ester cyclase [Anaerolineaceae bacterium]
MSATHFHTTIQRILREAFDNGNLAVVDKVLTSDHIVHNSTSGLINDVEGIKRLISTLRSAFPDLQTVMEDEIHEGEKFATHWTLCGTHNGLLMGITPTGKSMKIQGIFFARLADGMIAEYWMLIDLYGMLQQLGIIPR